ncbi:restriction endonuclease subunit S [Paralcaligenes ureilyticus]|nr:restriction endonuclease subunit S [Paralcaligenes ureilyticus]
MTLDQCCAIISGATPKTSNNEYWNGDICWTTPKDLSNLETHYLDDTPRKITKLGLASCGASILPRGSVLFSSRAPIGHVAINAVPMATNQGFKSFIPKAGILDAKFLFHWLRKNKAYLESLGNGATFKEVSKATVSRIEIALPPLVYQRRIAAILDQADALRVKRRDALAQLDSLTQSIFIEMFGDPVSNPKSWKIAPLSQCAERIQIGPFGTQLHEEDYIDGGIPLINPTHLRDGRISPDISLTVSEEKYAELGNYYLMEGDLIMGRRGEMGRCAVITSREQGWLCGTGSLFVRPKASVISPIYLGLVISSPSMRRFLENVAQGVTMANLNKTIVGAIPIPVPPIKKQIAFVSQLKATKEIKNQNRSSLAELNTLFASLQHRAFRGEL